MWWRGFVARSCEPGSSEPGFATPQFLLAVACSMVLLAVSANLVVQQYALAAVRASLDEGTRAGGLVGAGAAECRRRAEEAVRGLLGPASRRSVQVRCTRTAAAVTAIARVRLDGWAPLVPDLVTELRAEAVAEP